MQTDPAMAWLWIPIVIGAAAAQTARNAAQRSVTKTAGVMPATFIRFAFGLPFAAAALALVVLASGHSAPSPNARFLAWVAMGAVTQVMSTAFFVAAMAQRTFVVAVVFTKTEVLQVALFAVGYRGAMLALGPAEPAWMKGVYGLVWAMAIQYRAASSASRCRASSAWGSSCCWRGSW